MKKILILIMLFKVINLIALNTEYPEINTYSEEWQKAGLNVDFPTNNEYNVVNLSNANGNNIQNKINNFNYAEVGKPLLIKIPAGTFTVTEPIVMKSYVTIKGNHMFKKDSDMENRTILIFDFDNDYSGNTPNEITRHDHQKNCFVVHGEKVNNIINQIKYSAQVFDAFEYLWNISTDEKMSAKDLQSYINELTDWINITEQNFPPFLSKNNLM